MEFLKINFMANDISEVIELLESELVGVDIRIKSKEVKQEFTIKFKPYDETIHITESGIESLISMFNIMVEEGIIYDVKINRLNEL